jgi:NTE family protein
MARRIWLTTNPLCPRTWGHASLPDHASGPSRAKAPKDVPSCPTVPPSPPPQWPVSSTVSLDSLLLYNLQPPVVPDPPGCALVLMGGGARTAYQAGVLKAVAEMLGPRPFPFRWLFGTSAGALNAAFLASRADEGTEALATLAAFWLQLRSAHVYRLDAPRWVRANLLTAVLVLTRQVRRHRALLDSLPLVDTLHRSIDLARLERALEQRHIEVLGVTASSYTTGVHWTFCQTRPDHPVQPWQRPGRRAAFQPVTIEHLMASAAIPFLFPAVPLWTGGHKEYFGDGSMRQLAPLAPAIQFGARRILAIGVGQPQRSGLVPARSEDPTAGTIAGHAMASVFHDTLHADVEQAQRVSQAIARLPPELARALPYRPVDVLALHPSVSLDELAHQHIHVLPPATRNVLVGLGALDTRRQAIGSAAALASYLLFEPAFVQALIALGERDAWRQRDALMAFLCPPAVPEIAPAVP